MIVYDYDDAWVARYGWTPQWISIWSDRSSRSSDKRSDRTTSCATFWSEGLLESKTGRPDSGKCETDCEGKWIEKKMKRKSLTVWRYDKICLDMSSRRRCYRQVLGVKQDVLYPLSSSRSQRIDHIECQLLFCWTGCCTKKVLNEWSCSWPCSRSHM